MTLSIRKKRKKTKRCKNPFDKHHIFWIRKEWSKGELNKLRLHPYCIISVHRDTLHKFLHTHLACIPVPDKYIVNEVLEHLKYLEAYKAISLNDPIEKRLKVLIAIFDCVEQETADALREQLKLVYEFNKKSSS